MDASSGVFDDLTGQMVEKAVSSPARAVGVEKIFG
jgi:hypothetical protein